MTLIIGIFTRDIHDKKEIIFASDGLAVKYENNKKFGQDDDVEKIRKLTPKICMGYSGKTQIGVYFLLILISPESLL